VNGHRFSYSDYSMTAGLLSAVACRLTSAMSAYDSHSFRKSLRKASDRRSNRKKRIRHDKQALQNSCCSGHLW
jgi:hypothetical protein